MRKWSIWVGYDWRYKIFNSIGSFRSINGLSVGYCIMDLWEFNCLARFKVNVKSKVIQGTFHCVEVISISMHNTGIRRFVSTKGRYYRILSAYHSMRRLSNFWFSFPATTRWSFQRCLHWTAKLRSALFRFSKCVLIDYNLGQSWSSDSDRITNFPKSSLQNGNT